MSDLEVYHTNEHYVVTITVEKVSREFVGKTDYRNAIEAASTPTTHTEELHSLKFIKSDVDSALHHAIGHLELMKEDEA